MNCWGRLFLIMCVHMTSVNAGPLITYFFKPYPHNLDKKSPEKAARKLTLRLGTVPTTLAEETLRALDRSLVSGIFSTYGGYLAVSDSDGQTTFPLSQTSKTLYIVVSQLATPIAMSGNTIHHWELPVNVPYKMYSFEKRVDRETTVNYWDVQEEEAPKDKVIPVETIIIFARPKDIYIPLGVSVDNETTHFILPDMYVKKGVAKVSSALYVLNLRHYFGPISELFRKTQLRYLKHITY